HRSQWRGYNRHLCAVTNLAVKTNNIDRAHSNAAIARPAPDVPLFRRAVNVNVAPKRVRILHLTSAQPNDSRNDWIATRRVDWNYCAGATAIFENGSGGGAVADLVCDFQFAKRCPKAPRPIAQTEFRSRNRIRRYEIAFFEQRQLLIVNANHDVVLGVARGSAGRDEDCDSGGKSEPPGDVDLDDVDPTHDQIGRILVPLPWLRQRFLPGERGGRERSLPRPVGCRPARSVFREKGPAPDMGNLFRP